MLMVTAYQHVLTGSVDMDTLRKTNWLSLIALWPLYLILNASGLLRFYMDADTFQGLHAAYPAYHHILTLLLVSTVLLFPLALCTHWLKHLTRQIMAFWALMMFIYCALQVLQDGPTIFMPLMDAYGFMIIAITARRIENHDSRK